MPNEKLVNLIREAEHENDSPAINSKRKRSGPIPGGRSVDRVFQYKERRGGLAFTLRVNFDYEKTPSAGKVRLLDELKKIVRKLEV